MNVAFCINRLALIGFGVTISSLIRNCTRSKGLCFWILCADLSLQDKLKIKGLLDYEKYEGQYFIIDFDPFQNFSSLRPLHGDWTTYGRLILSDYITGRQVLYLDADLVIESDMIQLDNFDFEDHDLAAIRAGTLSTELDRFFYLNKLHLSPETDSFNAGVLLLNLLNWRTKNIKERCLELAQKYPDDLLSCDQTVLNGFFAGRFAKLPPSLNLAWLPEKSMPIYHGNAIFHFVGSPKPWDLFGSIIHRGYKTWKRYLFEDWNSYYGNASFASCKRAWKLRRSYARILLAYLKIHKY